MPQAYSSREKLALYMTGQRSLRQAAKGLGITHQKLGRWLKEGEPGGVKAIPADLFTRAAIDSAFDEHRARAREQAQAQGIPYRADAPPVFAWRRELSETDGQPRLSDRVRIDQAQYLGDELRAKVLKSFQRTGRFVGVAVRSVVSIIDYMRRKYADQFAQGRHPGASKRDLERLAREAARGFAEKRGDGDVRAAMALYTSREPMQRGADPLLMISSVQAKLREKHEPATHADGGAIARTVLADQISMQLQPEQSAAERIEAARRAAKRQAARDRRAGHVRGRGGK